MRGARGGRRAARPRGARRAEPTGSWRRSVAELTARRASGSSSRAPEMRSPLADALERLGAEVSIVPLIEIRAGRGPRRRSTPRSRASRPTTGSSSRASTGSRRLASAWADRSRARVAAVGPVTADAVRALGVEPAFVARALRRTSPPGSGRSTARGCCSRRPTSPTRGSRDELARSRGDRGRRRRLSHASRSSRRCWGIAPLRHRRCDRSRERLGRAQSRSRPAGRRRSDALLVCIGPKTASVAREVGLPVGLVADETTARGHHSCARVAFRGEHMTGYRHGSARRAPARAGRAAPAALASATAALRDLVRETPLAPDDLVYPLFVVRRGAGARARSPRCRASTSFSVDLLAGEARELAVARDQGASSSSASRARRTRSGSRATPRTASCSRRSER